MGFRLVITRQNAIAPFAEYPCTEPIISIGSDPAATIQLNGSGVAAEQVVILHEDSTLLLINRAEGTRLNGEPLNREARHPLVPGDTLHFATYLVTLQTDVERESILTSPAVETQITHYAEPTVASSSPSPIAELTQETKSFASILDSLRTEEDSFYFLFETGIQAGTRLLIDKTETLCGWDASGTHLSVDPTAIETQCMTVRKDWTGVVAHAPAGKVTLRVNDELLNAPRRLRNGDRLKLLAPADAPPAVLIFHEPASLVALDTLLPQPLPPPVALTKSSAGSAASLEPTASPKQPKRTNMQFDWEYRYFGYFNLLELGIMAAGTLVAAVIIFLVLQYA